jgi:hypothetical protein
MCVQLRFLTPNAFLPQLKSSVKIRPIHFLLLRPFDNFIIDENASYRESSTSAQKSAKFGFFPDPMSFANSDSFPQRMKKNLSPGVILPIPRELFKLSD